MTDPNADDRNAADTQYHNAVETAKAEYDLLYPQFRKLNERMVTLKRFIVAGSGLLNIAVDDRFDYRMPPSIATYTHPRKRS